MNASISSIAQKAFEHLDSPAIFTDEKGFLVWCNPSFERLSEYKLQEIKGKRPGEFLQGEDSDPEVIKIMSQAIRDQRGFEIEIENYSKSGKKYITQISCEPVFDDTNKLIGFFSIQPRVSRKKIIQEKKIAESKHLLETIIDNAEVAIIIADDDMIVRRVNRFASDMLVYSVEELVGMNVMDYTRKVIHAENLWNEFIEVNTQVGEIELLHKSGAVVYGKYKAIANVLPGKHLSVITDITHRKRYEREILAKNHELAKANEAMKTLFSIIGHDLQSPLFNLQSALELLEIPDIDPNEYKDLFISVGKALESNKTMLSNLLNWANQQQGGFKIKPVDVDIKGLVNELCDAHRQRAEHKGVNISMSLPENSIELNTDPEALRLVLRNLCSNAIKFCNKGDTIGVKVIDHSDYINIEVSDTGRGISEEDLQRIFSTGFTTKGSKNEKGTGLGLTLCKEFLGMLDSKLDVESELGKGTKFFFNLKK